MKLTTEITCREEALAAIDILGDNLAQIEALQRRNRTLKDLFEAWAKVNPEEANGQTGRFSFSMEADAPSLRIQSHLDREDVVARLRTDPEMAEFVVTTYDAKAIKAAFGGSKSKRAGVETFGLRFTENAKHLKVESL